MDLDVSKFIDGLKDDALTLAKGDLKDFIQWATSEDTEFVKEQGALMNKYLRQLATKQISADEFKDNVQDLADVAEMEALKNLVAGKAAIQRFADGLKNLVVGGLSKLI